ncbi:MAG: TRAP transporter small permease [Rhodobacterales bacterium]|nr:TRAP transporter small permease [Rhodobacterales bacterium]
MAGGAAVLEDNSVMSRLDRALFRVEGWLALLSGIAVFSLMLMAVWTVGGRNFFGAPLRGYVDWIEQAMPLIAFMGIAYTQRQGGHIRMDMVVGALRGRLLWAAESITTFAVLVLMVLLVWGSWAHFQRSFDFGAVLWSRDSSMDIGLPLWPAKLLVPVAFSVLCLRLMLQLWGYGRAFALNLEAPVGVPLVQSAAEIAAAEAQTVSAGPKGAR